MLDSLMMNTGLSLVSSYILARYIPIIPRHKRIMPENSIITAIIEAIPMELKYPVAFKITATIKTKTERTMLNPPR